MRKHIEVERGRDMKRERKGEVKEEGRKASTVKGKYGSFYVKVGKAEENEGGR